MRIGRRTTRLRASASGVGRGVEVGVAVGVRVGSGVGDGVKVAVAGEAVNGASVAVCEGCVWVAGTVVAVTAGLEVGDGGEWVTSTSHAAALVANPRVTSAPNNLCNENRPMGADDNMANDE
jgi:hypothetical protein